MIDSPWERALSTAQDFVRVVDQRYELERDPWLAAVHRDLTAFYAAVLALSWDDRDSDISPPASGFTHGDWTVLYRDLGAPLGPLDRSREVFDPYGATDEPPVVTSLADGIASVYKAARDVLETAATVPIPDAVNDLIVEFEIHAGHHATDVLRALHAARFGEGAADSYRARAVVVQRRVQQPPDEVFAAWTTAEGLARWWWPHLGDTTYRINARAGGMYDIRSQAAGIGVEGEITDIDPPRRLCLTWRWLNDGVREPDEPVEVQFDAVQSGTLVTIRHELHAGSDEGDGIRQGWESVLGRLAGPTSPSP